MRDFAARFLSSLPEVDGFILKHRSPSCGMKDIKVYSGSAKAGAVSKTTGFFGGAMVKSFPNLAVEDEGRLRNFNIREHFLNKIYALASFRRAQIGVLVSDLVQFHTTNKLLLAAHSQKESKILGNIVARKNLDFAEQARLYRAHLSEALKRPPRYTSKANVLMHSLGYISKELSHDEKAYFLQNIERFKSRKRPFSALLAVLQSWLARFGQEYLRDQTLFKPFPEDLIDLCHYTQCEWAGHDLFEGRDASREPRNL